MQLRGGSWHVRWGVGEGEADLTAAESAAMAAIFARLEVSPDLHEMRRAMHVTFVRTDHTECHPQNGADTWRVRYEQTD